MSFYHTNCLTILLLQFSFHIIFGGDKISVPMRVVKDTATFSFFGANSNEIEFNQLILSVKPANFSGPLLLKRLSGKCYNLTQERYKYVFCPFENITQYEISTRWNAYQGVLGVWNEWKIENNTFHSMIYSHGDNCGDIDRTVQVALQCGEVEALMNVTEPEKCHYAAVFATRYVCHKDALLVYPRLNTALQKEWDQLLTEFHYGDITEKGYELGLQKIFKKAGLFSVGNIETIRPPSNATAAQPDLTSGNIFMDLQTCNKEYENLQREVTELHAEVEALKLILDLKGVRNKTPKPHR